eukprot:gene16713-19867_t
MVDESVCEKMLVVVVQLKGVQNFIQDANVMNGCEVNLFVLVLSSDPDLLIEYIPLGVKGKVIVSDGVSSLQKIQFLARQGSMVPYAIDLKFQMNQTVLESTSINVTCNNHTGWHFEKSNLTHALRVDGSQYKTEILYSFSTENSDTPLEMSTDCSTTGSSKCTLSTLFNNKGQILYSLSFAPESFTSKQSSLMITLRDKNLVTVTQRQVDLLPMTNQTYKTLNTEAYPSALPASGHTAKSVYLRLTNVDNKYLNDFSPISCPMFRVRDTDLVDPTFEYASICFVSSNTKITQTTYDLLIAHHSYTVVDYQYAGSPTSMPYSTSTMYNYFNLFATIRSCAHMTPFSVQDHVLPAFPFGYHSGNLTTLTYSAGLYIKFFAPSVDYKLVSKSSLQLYNNTVISQVPPTVLGFSCNRLTPFHKYLLNITVSTPNDISYIFIKELGVTLGQEDGYPLGNGVIRFEKVIDVILVVDYYLTVCDVFTNCVTYQNGDFYDTNFNQIKSLAGNVLGAIIQNIKYAQQSDTLVFEIEYVSEIGLREIHLNFTSDLDPLPYTLRLNTKTTSFVPGLNGGATIKGNITLDPMSKTQVFIIDSALTIDAGFNHLDSRNPNSVNPIANIPQLQFNYTKTPISTPKTTLTLKSITQTPGKIDVGAWNRSLSYFLEVNTTGQVFSRNKPVMYLSSNYNQTLVATCSLVGATNSYSSMCNFDIPYGWGSTGFSVSVYGWMDLNYNFYGFTPTDLKAIGYAPAIVHSFSPVLESHSPLSKMGGKLTIMGHSLPDCDVLECLLQNGTIVRTVVFSNWTYAMTSTPNRDTHSYSTLVDDGFVNATIEWFKEQTLINFANQTIVMSPFTAKYSVNISLYSFQSPLNHLQLEFKTILNNIKTNECSDASDDNDPLPEDYVELNISQKSLLGRFQAYGIVDDRRSLITSQVLSTTPNGTNSITKIIGMNVPYFTYVAQIDPDFSVLMNGNDNPCSSAKNNTKLIIIVLDKHHKKDMAQKIRRMTVINQ